ncbi:MAG: cytochrome c oxidase subunit II [Chloroflexia bacterium]
MPDPNSPLAHDISNLYNTTLIISAVILLGVAGLVVYMAVRWRRGGAGEPRQDYGNRKLEIAWTIAPAVLLAVILGFTIPTMGAETPPPPKAPGKPDLLVTGHQFWWEVRYTATDVVSANEIHIPTGTKWLVGVTSDDVIHDLWIPQLGPKMDTIPGQMNYMWLQADRPGTYEGACAEFCGDEHAWMRIKAVATSPTDYNTWIAAQRPPAQQAVQAAAARGAQIFTQRTCISCHAIAGTAAKAEVGPDLTHFATRMTIGAGVLKNTPDNVRLWLEDPQKVKPGNKMPNLRLTNDELDSLTAYLETLK